MATSPPPFARMEALNHPNRRGGRYDPTFTGNRTQPLHRWVPWVAGYSAEFVDDALESYNSHAPKSRVLDPFAGVGTTLIEAHFHGHDSIGFEVNPYAALAARVKLAAGTDLRSSSLLAVAEAYSQYAERSPDPTRNVPDGFTSRIPFFSPRVERKVLTALDFCDSLDDPWDRDAFRVALGSVMVSFSNYTYEPSLGSRPGAGKALIPDADVRSILHGKLSQMAQDVAGIEKGPALADTRREIHGGSFLEAAPLGGRLCDIAITSPPYLNNYHYLRNTRPQLWWLDLADSQADLAHIERDSMGKFWQTVRASEPVGLEFESERATRLLKRIAESRPGHGVYGSQGWANYAATYFNDTRLWLAVLFRVLRPGGIGIVVIGNSIIQGVPVDTGGVLSEIAAQVGFENVTTDLLRKKRVGDSIVRSSVRRGVKAAPSAGLYESAVILRRLA